MQLYTVTINGIEHTIQLADEQTAKRWGARPVERKSAEPKNKSRSPRNKGQDE